MHKSFNLTKKSSHDFEFFQIFKKNWLNVVKEI
jgi:hypothetical protein